MLEKEEAIFTILIVEDDPVLNQRILLSLQKHQWWTVGVHNAGEALDWLEQQSADLLLIDYRLPDLSVEEFMARLPNKTAFIVMTAYADVRIAVDMMKMGAMDYLIKDTEFFNLLPAVLGKAIKQLTMEKALQHYQEELKVSEMLARQQEKRARKVFESVMEGILVLSGNGSIIMVNPYFTVITGYREPEIKDKSYQKLLPGDYPAHKQEEIIYNLRQYGLWEGEATVRCKNGECFPAYIEISSITEMDAVAFQYIIILRDISQQKRLEEEKQRLQEQKERVNRLASLSAMSAGLVHEIAQPLNALKVIADGSLLLMELGRELPQPKIKDCLQGVARQANRIENIIKNMRSFASPETSRTDTQVDVNRAIKEVLHMLSRQLNDHGITLEEVYCPETAWLMGSKQSIDQIIVNLVVNAIQAFAGCNHSNKVLRISTVLQANELRIMVEDNASGIDVPNMFKIFDPFFTTKAIGEGTGLGLSIVNAIITNMNGRIEAVNNQQGGASFYINLPVISDYVDKEGDENENIAG